VQAVAGQFRGRDIVPDVVGPRGLGQQICYEAEQVPLGLGDMLAAMQERRHVVVMMLVLDERIGLEYGTQPLTGVVGLVPDVSEMRLSGEPASRRDTHMTDPPPRPAYLRTATGPDDLYTGKPPWDALKLADLGESFDTVLDSGLFHHIGEKDRAAYVGGVRSVLVAGGRYFMLFLGDSHSAQHGDQPEGAGTRGPQPRSRPCSPAAGGSTPSKRSRSTPPSIPAASRPGGSP
jgi:hypothetical protein